MSKVTPLPSLVSRVIKLMAVWAHFSYGPNGKRHHEFKVTSSIWDKYFHLDALFYTDVFAWYEGRHGGKL